MPKMVTALLENEAIWQLWLTFGGEVTEEAATSEASEDEVVTLSLPLRDPEKK